MVSKNVEKGKVVKVKSGKTFKYDTENRVNKLYIKERQEIMAAEGKTHNIAEKETVRTNGKISVPTISTPEINEDAVNNRLLSKKYKLEKEKWNATNERLKAEKEMAILVEVELIQEVFNKIASVVNNDLLQRGQRDSNLLCGLLGVSDKNKILQVKEHLEASDIRTIKSIKDTVKTFNKELKKRIREQRGNDEEV